MSWSVPPPNWSCAVGQVLDTFFAGLHLKPLRMMEAEAQRSADQPISKMLDELRPARD